MTESEDDSKERNRGDLLKDSDMCSGGWQRAANCRMMVYIGQRTSENHWMGSNLPDW